jgi:hypothetical protein
MIFNHTVKRAAVSLSLVLLTQLSVFAQDAAVGTPPPQQSGPLGRIEVPDTEEQRRFVEAHSLENPAMRQKQGEREAFEAEPFVQGSRQVRVVYLVPSDKIIRADYHDAIAKAISDLQVFYRDQVGGGLTYSIHAPAVEIYQTSHPSDYYSTGYNERAGGFFESVLADGFALAGGGFNDPNNRWLFYVDADLVCGQYTGASSGVALLPANDLRGLTGQPTVRICPNDSNDMWGVNRWVGGLGHELGHTLGLPHPPGCDAGACTGGPYAFNSLLYVGYASYPNTYLLDEDRTTLRACGFLNSLTLDPWGKYSIGGRVTNQNNAAVAGATVTLDETHESVLTDAYGNYKFTGLPAGGTYSVSVAKAGYTFAPPGVFFNNLDRNRVANFQSTTLIYQVKGRVVSGSAGLGGVTVTITGAQDQTTTTDSAGNYSFAVEAYRYYEVKPSKAGYHFSPTGREVPYLTGNVRVPDFTGSRTAVHFTGPAYGVAEGSGGTITVRRAGDLSGTTTVNYAATAGTAMAGSDFTAVTGTLTFGPGAATRTFVIPTTGDLADEDGETVKLSLSAATGAVVISPDAALLTINDNDLAPGLKVNDATVSEANTGYNTTATFTVSLTAPSSRTITVYYLATGGTATEFVDFTNADGMLSFTPGQTSKTVMVKVTGDLLDELDENFKLLLRWPSNATIARGQGICTIKDNDLAPSITITNATVTEPDAGTLAAAFNVRLSAPSAKTVSVKYATANGTTNPAAAGTDYTAVTTLTAVAFAPGETAKTIYVQVKGDLLKEANETFFVNLSGAVNATVRDAQGLGTILNDD